MSFFSKLLFGKDRCTECGAPSKMAPLTPSYLWETTSTPFEQRLNDLHDFLNIQSSGPDSVCRENPRTNQLECQLYLGRGFRPENVEVNVTGHQVELKARQEHVSDDGQNYSLSEIRRTFMVPNTADMDGLTASMESNGRFILQAPLLKQTVPSQTGPVPIEIKRK